MPARMEQQAVWFQKECSRPMLNNQSGLSGPSNNRNQFNQFGANQIQGGGNAFQLGGNPSLQQALQGNFNLQQGMQGILQGGRAGVSGLQQPGSNQQNAGQGRFNNAQLAGGMPQFPHGLGRSGVVGFPAMNGLSGVNPNPAARGAVGGPGGGMNAALGGAASLRPGGGIDRGGLPPQAALGLGGLGAGALQQRQGQAGGGPQNLNLGRSMGMGPQTSNLGGPMGPMGSGQLPGSFNNALGIQAGSPRVHGAGQLHGGPASKDLLAMIGKGAATGGGTGPSQFSGAGGAFGSMAMSPGQGGLAGPHGHAGNQQGHKGGSSQDPSEQLAFNPSDFPALGGGGASAHGRPEAGRRASQHLQNLPNGNATSSGPGGANQPPAALVVGADLYASMHMNKGAQEPFSMQQDEFPALPGTGAVGSRGGGEAASSQAPQTSAALTHLPQRQQVQQQQHHQQQAQQQQQQALPSPFLRASALGAAFTGGLGQQHEEGQRRSFADMPSGNVLTGQSSRQGPTQQEQAILYHMQQHQHQQQQQQQQHQHPQQRYQQSLPKAQAPAGPVDAQPHASAPASSSQAESAEHYGLLGLLTVISMSDADVTTLALGTDLTTLGLHLNGVEPVYDTFASPWADNPIKPDPDFKVPSYYRHKPPRLHLGYLSKFSQETLFYVFYSMPGDEAQILAADELSHRGWWFHKDHKVWLKRLITSDASHKPVPERPSSTAYLIFDPTNWEVIRKDNIMVLLSDLERPPNLARPNTPPAGSNQQVLPSGHPGHGHGPMPHMSLA